MSQQNQKTGEAGRERRAEQQRKNMAAARRLYLLRKKQGTIR